MKETKQSCWLSSHDRSIRPTIPSVFKPFFKKYYFQKRDEYVDSLTVREKVSNKQKNIKEDLAALSKLGFILDKDDYLNFFKSSKIKRRKRRQAEK